METLRAHLHAHAAVGGPSGKVKPFYMEFNPVFNILDTEVTQLPTVSQHSDESRGQNNVIKPQFDNDADPKFRESFAARRVGSFATDYVEKTFVVPGSVNHPEPEPWCGYVSSNSPFYFLQLLLAHLFWFLGYLTRDSRESIFFGKRSFLFFCVALPVIPLCGHRTDNLLRERLVTPHLRSYALGHRTLGTLSISTFGPGLCLIPMEISWRVWSWVRNPSVCRGTLGRCDHPIPWTEACRMGEAKNPGPPSKFQH